MKNCNQRDEDTSIANRPSGLVEVFGVPMKAAKTLANALGDLKRTEKGAAVLNKINKLFPPTQGIVDMLVANGFPQAKKINDYFKKSRAKTEFYLRRATERVIEPMMALKTADLRSFEMLSELANESSVYKINPFNSRSKYENQEFEFRNETGRVEKQDGGILWDRVNTKLNALRDRNPKAVTALKNLFDEYEFFRNQFLDGLIKQVKVRSGEVNVPDNQTKPETFEAITQIKNGFAEADADAYIAFLRQGNHTVNTYELEPIYQTDEATGDEEIVGFKRLPDVLKNESFLSQREADTYIEAEKIRLAQEYQKQIKGSPEAQQKLIEAALEYITKSDQVNRETGQGIAIAGNFSNNLERVKQALDKTIHQLDPNLADDVRLARQAEITQNIARIDTMLKQLFPETSVRKNLSTPRKGTPGYMTDVLEVFAQMTNRYAVQLGALEHTAEFSRDMTDMRERHRKMSGLTLKERDTKQEVLNGIDALQEIRSSQGQIPESMDKWANMANRIGFMWYMGFNPMTALVNMLQVGNVTYPAMRGKFGYDNDVLAGIEREIARAYGNVYKASKFINMTMAERLEELSLLTEAELKKEYGLTKDEVEMLRFNDERGELRSGMHVYDMDSVLANASGFQQTLDAFNRASGFMFQKAELFNREVTALVSYRLATTRKRLGRAKPLAKGSKEAFEFSNRSIVETQGAYASDQAPGAFRMPLVRFFAMFKKYPAFMAHLYIKMFKQMLGKSFPEGVTTVAEKRAAKIEALRQFTGMMGMAAITAGTVGMPFYYIVRDLANLMFDDEDDPYDFDLFYAQFLDDKLGSKTAALIYKGLLNYATGVDFQSRVSYSGIFLLGGGAIEVGGVKLPFLGGVTGLRDIREGEYDSVLRSLLEEAAGAGPSMMFGVLEGAFKDILTDGDVTRGIEKMTPIALRNVLKTYRYSEEDGIRTKRGDAVVEDLKMRELIIQALGGAPDRAATQYFLNRKAKNIEQALLQRKNRLADRYFKLERKYGRNSKEAEEYRKKEIEKFNRNMSRRGHKGLVIDSAFIKKSRKIRNKFTANQIFDGVSIQKSLQKELVPYLNLFDEDEDEDEDED